MVPSAPISWSVQATRQGLPYKQFSFHPGNSSSAQPDGYINNPVFPLLLELKQKAWVEPVSNNGTPAIETNVQLFTSHYNPYNVGIYMAGDGPVAGARVMKYPQVLFTVSNGTTKCSTA